MNIVCIGGSHGIGESFIKKMQEKHEIFTFSRTVNPHLKATHKTYDIQDEKFPVEHLPECVDGFVYFPGSINLRSFQTLKIDDFRKEWDINVGGAIKSLQAVYPHLKKSQEASVVLISTVAAHRGMNFHTSIASSKAAVEGLALSLASEWAPHIRVNVVAPSLTETPLAQKILSNEKMRLASEEKHPLKKIGHPDDIASMIAYLLSQEAKWMTGQVINIDGGLSRL